MEIGHIKKEELEDFDKRDLIEAFLNFCTRYAKYCIQENYNPNEFNKQSQYFEIEMGNYYKDFWNLDIKIKMDLYNLFPFYLKKQYAYLKTIENIFKN